MRFSEEEWKMINTAYWELMNQDRRRTLVEGDAWIEYLPYDTHRARPVRARVHIPGLTGSSKETVFTVSFPY